MILASRARRERDARAPCPNLKKYFDLNHISPQLFFTPWILLFPRNQTIDTCATEIFTLLATTPRIQFQPNVLTNAALANGPPHWRRAPLQPSTGRQKTRDGQRSSQGYCGDMYIEIRGTRYGNGGPDSRRHVLMRYWGRSRRTSRSAMSDQSRRHLWKRNVWRTWTGSTTWTHCTQSPSRDILIAYSPRRKDLW